MRKYAVIVAGGSGTRMQLTIPKQFLMLANKPILMHTIEQFFIFDPYIKIILVLPKSHFDNWQQLCGQYQFKIPHTLVAGGATRFQSVKNGLAQIQEEGVVAIHDGVRPLVHIETIHRSFELAKENGAAITKVALKDSIRFQGVGESKAVDRTRYCLVQTPQTFKSELIKEAYQITETSDLTDDASVFEKAGFEVTLLEGTYDNIKITTPEDLVVAEALLKIKKKA